MHNKFRNIGLIFIGVIAGVLISLNFQAVADRAARTVLPIEELRDRKSTRLNSSHSQISYAVFCLKKKKISFARSVRALPSDAIRIVTARVPGTAIRFIANPWGRVVVVVVVSRLRTLASQTWFSLT